MYRTGFWDRNYTCMYTFSNEFMKMQVLGAEEQNSIQRWAFQSCRVAENSNIWVWFFLCKSNHTFKFFIYINISEEITYTSKGHTGYPDRIRLSGNPACFTGIRLSGRTVGDIRPYSRLITKIELFLRLAKYTL